VIEVWKDNHKGHLVTKYFPLFSTNRGGHPWKEWRLTGRVSKNFAAHHPGSTHVGENSRIALEHILYKCGKLDYSRLHKSTLDQSIFEIRHKAMKTYNNTRGFRNSENESKKKKRKKSKSKRKPKQKLSKIPDEGKHFTDRQILEFDKYDGPNRNLFHFSQRYSNAELFISNATIAGIQEFRKPYSHPHEVIEFEHVRGNADTHFEHVFEKYIDSHRVNWNKRRWGGNDAFAFMVQIKTYLELFSLHVVKHSVTECESRFIFDAFHDTELHFKDDPTVNTHCYKDVKTRKSRNNFYDYNDMWSIVVKVVPGNDGHHLSHYMLFSFKITNNIILLIPALDHTNVSKSTEASEFEAAFFDIVALTACAMNMKVVTEVHQQTFKNCALEPFWRDTINDFELIGYPKMLPLPLKYFAHDREIVGKLIKLRRFAGINIVWGSKFNTDETTEKHQWRQFLDFGSLRVPNANLFAYWASSAERSSEGGCKLPVYSIFDIEFDKREVFDDVYKRNKQNLKMKDVKILELRLPGILIEDLTATKEILDYKKLAQECNENTNTEKII
jgi:hypothetical protein